MPIIYRIDPEIGITYLVLDGVVVGDDYVEHTRRMLADPAWPPSRRLHLSDVTSQKDPSPLMLSTSERMADLWQERADHIAEMKIAVVASEAFGNAQTLTRSLTRYGPTTIVFNLISTACIWLGIDEVRASQTLAEMRAEARKTGSV